MARHTRLTIAVLMVALSGTATLAGTPCDTERYIWWADDDLDAIVFAQTGNPSDMTEIVTGLSAPFGLALDPAAGHVYWTDEVADAIYRADLDGMNVVPIITTGLLRPREVEIDPVGGKLYWTDIDINEVQRSNLDGTGRETIGSSSHPMGIELDQADGRIYWAERDGGVIYSANFDGSAVFPVVPGLDSPWDLALDEDARYLYWTEWLAGEIWRISLVDGTRTRVLDGLESPRYIEVDSSEGWLYWSTGASDGGQVWFATLAGEQPQPVFYAAGQPRDVSIQITTQPCHVCVEDVVEPPDPGRFGYAAVDVGFDPISDSYVMITGAPDHDDNGSLAGAAYVHRWDGTDWNLEQKLFPSDPAPSAQFGSRVVIGSDLALVANNAFTDDAAVYVFELDGATWAQRTRLPPPETMSPVSCWGFAMDLVNDFYFAIGATAGEDSHVAIYRDTGASIEHVDDLAPTPGPQILSLGAFGQSVDIGKSLTIAVTDWGAQIDDGSWGAAWVFEYGATASWSQTQEILPPEPSISFGDDIVIDTSGQANTRMAISEFTTADGPGRCQLYRHDGVEWIHSTTLSAWDAASDLAGFAWEMDFYGDLLVAGDYNAGAAYAFQFDGVSWAPLTKLEEPTLDHFGWAVSLIDEVLAVGHLGGGDGVVTYRLDTAECPLLVAPAPPSSAVVPAILAAHPNPFSGSTTVTFDVTGPGLAEVAVFDATGRLVRHLVEPRNVATGRHAARWDGRDDRDRRVAPGVYVIRLETESGVTASRRLVLTR